MDHPTLMLLFPLDQFSGFTTLMMKALQITVTMIPCEEVSTDIEDLQRIRNKASTDTSKASTDNIHQRISASMDKTSTANASTDKASTDKASTDKASTDESFNGCLVQ
ncbi:hypothetical protein AgCh_024595 [Apium graveolens]